MHILITGGTLNPLKDTYVNALSAMGHTAEVLYPGDNYPSADDFTALLLPGGGDIHPKRFNMALLPNNTEMLDEARDEWEFSIFNDFYKKEKPIFGICRGMQVINVALGGTLWQDLPSQRGIVHTAAEGQPPLWHDITMFGAGKISVNSYHHQAVMHMGMGLHITARSKDGVAESLVHETRPIRAVQWHPEIDGFGMGYLLAVFPT